MREILEFLGHVPNPEHLREGGRSLQWPGKLSDERVARLTGPLADILETLGFIRLVAERLGVSAT